MKTLAVALVALSASALSAQQPLTLTPTPPPAISAVGRGEARVAPDRATILFAVETRAATAATASAQNATLQRRALDALRSAGLPADRISTTGFTLTPDLQWDQEGRVSRVVGYIARNTVRADVRELADLGKIIDAVIAAGVNKVGALQFSSSREAEVRRESLQMAVQSACRDAAAVAAATGGTLGPLLDAQTMDTPRFGGGEMMMARAASDAAQTPITPGELTLETNVATRWAYGAPGTTPAGGATTCR